MTKTHKTTCWKCNGTGKFYAGGMVLNGVYTGKVGVCFACEGKGHQTVADEKRNRAYWNYRFAAA